MKRSMKRAASLTLAAALIVTGVYCGGNEAQAAKKAKKITMNKKKVNITVGGKFTLKVKKVTPKKASKAVKYKSSNKKIASVSKKGVVKGRKVGKATITVTSKSNKKAKAKVTVNVKSKQQTPIVTQTPVVTQNPVVTQTPVVTPTPDVPSQSVAPLNTPTPAQSGKPSTKPTKSPKPPTIPPTEKPKAEEPADEVLDVMAISELDVAEGITKTDNEDGSVTLDFTGTSYKGARWYFIDGDKKDAEGKPVRKALNLEKYTYVVVEGVNQEGVKLEASENNPDVKKGHDLSAQFLDALDHASHGGLLEIETQANMFFPIKFDLKDDNRVNVAAFEIYSLGDAASKKAGPITVKSIKAYKDKAAYDKLTATPDPDASPSPDPDATPAPDFTAAKISSGAAIEVDGDGKDDVWKYIPELPIENVVPIEGATVSPDSTATAKLAWDENNLYGLVKVTDTNISFTATADHERDGVEFFLDEDYSMDTDFAVNTDAFQYRLTGLKGDSAGVETAATDEIKGGSDAAKSDYAGIETAYSINDSGYVVEFKIPFKTVKKAGDRVGFDIIVQDCTGDARAAEIYLRKTDKALSYWNLSDTFGTLELGTDFAAAKISAPVTIDGQVDEVWNAAAVSSQAIQYKPTGTTDTMATAKIVWDENNLYGLVEVSDDNISLAAAASHERDGVEFFLDEDYSMDKGFAVNTDAFQYRLTGLEKDGDGVKKALTDEIAGGSNAAKNDYAGIETAYSITDGGYVVEFKIPFKVAKKAGDLVGFDIIVQACTGDKRDAEIYLRNTKDTLSYWNLEDTFGTLVLKG